MKAFILFTIFLITAITFIFLITEEQIQSLPTGFSAYLSMVCIFLLYDECKKTKTN